MSEQQNSEAESVKLDDVQLDAAVGGTTISALIPCIKTRVIVPCVKTITTKISP